jgi:hypothetical protein
MLHTDYKRKISLLELDAADTLGWFFIGSKILFFQFFFKIRENERASEPRSVVVYCGAFEMKHLTKHLQ